LSFKCLNLRIMTKKFVIQITAHALLVDSKSFHRELHPIERSRFPHIIDRKVVSAIGRNSGLLAFTSWRPKLEPYFIRDVVGNLDDVADAL
jgi:hypothetical protein